MAAGTTSSFCCMIGDQLCAWGKLKVSGDNTMYPKPMMELAGWNIRSLACGANTYSAAASSGDEQATVAWCAWPLHPSRSQRLWPQSSREGIVAAAMREKAAELVVLVEWEGESVGKSC